MEDSYTNVPVEPAVVRDRKLPYFLSKEAVDDTEDGVEDKVVDCCLEVRLESLLFRLSSVE